MTSCRRKTSCYRNGLEIPSKGMQKPNLDLDGRPRAYTFAITCRRLHMPLSVGTWRWSGGSLASIGEDVGVSARMSSAEYAKWSIV
jgi:hypothetical protein